MITRKFWTFGSCDRDGKRHESGRKAKNGEEMCQIIKDKQPDVVLLDLIMPKMDGLTVMDRINHDKTVSKHPYFIVITAVGQEKITEDAFNKGANYYMMKPFQNEMLLERIRRRDGCHTVWKQETLRRHLKTEEKVWRHE